MSEIQYPYLSSLLVRSTDDCVGLSTIPINPIFPLRSSYSPGSGKGGRKVSARREDEIVLDIVEYLCYKNSRKKITKPELLSTT